MPQGLSYVLYRGYGLGSGNLRSLEDVFAGRCLCRVNVIFYIDVGCVIVTKSTVNVIRSTVGGENRVIGGTTEQVVLTETAIYAVRYRLRNVSRRSHRRRSNGRCLADP
jgi:hypothetical protein